MICTGIGPCRLLLAVLVVSLACLAAAIQGPRSECYTLDNHNYLYDFTDWIGKEFQFAVENEPLYTLRFCKDVQATAVDKSIVNFGRYSPAYSSSPPDTAISFLQEYRSGDLKGCEKESNDYNGRGTQVAIICGTCPPPFKEVDGCICSVTPAGCRSSILLALKCSRGPRIFPGFTVGFSPRGKEVVENGIPQWGYDKFRNDYRTPIPEYPWTATVDLFNVIDVWTMEERGLLCITSGGYGIFVTQQSRVLLYLSAQSKLVSNLGKPTIEVNPAKGLNVQLSGTATNGLAPTVESPTILEIDWRCEKQAPTPYVVNVTVPVQDYDPVSFILAKHCDYKENVERTGSNGWATFGILSFLSTVGLTMFCCAGFLYRSRIEDKHGLDALPGFSAFTSCIESVSGDHSGYAPANDVTNLSVSHNGSGGSGRGVTRASDGTSYGAV